MCYRSYPLAKLYYREVIRHGYPRGEPIVIYQMGKVGSKTIEGSLRAQTRDRPIFHVHFLTQEGLRREEAFYRRHWSKDKGGVHVWEGQYLRRRLAGKPPNDKWHVVTLVREPIGRNVSDFFQTGAREFDLDFDDASLVEDRIDELTSLFLERFSRHDLPLTWFDDELLPALGIDVYATPFPHERGYEIYENETVRLLLIRLEDLRAQSAEAFLAFLGIRHFELLDSNTAEDKAYASVYKRFVSGVQMPPEYADRVYGSKYTGHFYTSAEIDAFRKRWRVDGGGEETA
jgi:hypothetical protein